MQGIRPRYTIVFRGSITPQTGAYFQNKTGSDYPRHAKAAAKNLHIKISTDEMPLKLPDSEKIKNADCIFFAGGGIFGFSYGEFFDSVAFIVSEAEKNNIPVFFSSVGYNNQNSSGENDGKLKALLKKDCVKDFSVREFPELFKKYTASGDVKTVCDPAVWVKDIFKNYLEAAPAEKDAQRKPVVGINIVRGGLFADNGIEWKLKDEAEYTVALYEKLSENGFDCLFYTNGSTLDNNTMLYIAEKYGLPQEKLIFVNSSYDLVKTVRRFDFTAAVRMHSSIISYSPGIPSTNLLWNDKITAFYKQTGRPECVVTAEKSAAEKTADLINDYIGKTAAEVSDEYKMSIYDYIFDCLKTFCKNKNRKMYSKEKVGKILSEYEYSEDEKNDLLWKIKRGESRYLALFKSENAKKAEIKKLKEQPNN